MKTLCESTLTRTADTVYAFRFLRLLTTPWKELNAYKLGIINSKGKVIRKRDSLKTDEEKSAYNIFHRLVFSIKRLLNKLPLGKTTIASYIAALYLLKEHTGMSEYQIKGVLLEAGCPIPKPELTESFQAGYEIYLPEGALNKITGNRSIRKLSRIESIHSFLGYKIYESEGNVFV